MSSKISLRKTIFFVGVAGLTSVLLAAEFLSPLSPVAVRHLAAQSPARIVVAEVKTIGSDLSYPEGVALDSTGALIVGTDDGILHRLPWTNTEAFGHPVPFAHIQGHSIGLALNHKNNVLWSATFPFGLQSISGEGAIHSIKSVDGKLLGFPDDVALGPGGNVFVTDGSTKFNPQTVAPDAPYVLWELLEGKGNGRVISHDPITGNTHTLLDKIAFPSGIALTPDKSALLIVEISRYRVLRYALTGPNIGQISIFAENLPGIPDDVFVGPQNNIWVTLAAPRSKLMDRWVMPFPYVARVISILPYSWQHALLSPVDGTGSVLMLGSLGDIRCQIKVPQGAPPANGIAWNNQLLLGRLGGHELLIVDPTPCW